MKKLLLTSVISASIIAGIFSPKIGAAQEQTIQDVCLLSQLKCLSEIERRQPNEKTRSFEWYQMEMLRHQSLFELERFDELITTLEPWQSYDHLPHSFALSVAIHKAKMLLMLGDKPAATRELNFAVNLLGEITNFNGNPMLIVMMANALLVMGDLERGYQALIALEEKYQRSPDPLLRREMYANLGHFATRLIKREESIHYRKLSLVAVIEVDNTQQIGVAFYNLASAYSDNEQYFEAVTNYQNAIKSARQSLDRATGTKARLRITECYLKIGNYVNAREVLQTVNLYNIPTLDEERYHKLLAELNEKNPVN